MERLNGAASVRTAELTVGGGAAPVHGLPRGTVGGRRSWRRSFVTLRGGFLGGSFGGRLGTVGGGAAPVHGLPLDFRRAAGGEGGKV